jgi:hypothetical protein
MQTNTKVYISLGIVVTALAAGGSVRYSVLEGRQLPDQKPVTNFTECLEAQYDLDITGSVCTTPDGKQYLKPGTATASTTVPSDITASTTDTTGTTSMPAVLILNTPTTFTIGEAKPLPNGTTLTLKQINDSRCKPDVQCIWAGELSTDWIVTQNTLTKTFSLGTVRTPATTTANYTYTLTTADETHATITVSTPSTPIVGTTGMVTGQVSIGPICPVESVDHPCVVPPETYTSRSVIVYSADGTTELEHHTLSDTGAYRLTLKTGNYALQIRPAGIGAGELKRVTVSADHSTVVDFAIDTGIR